MNRGGKRLDSKKGKQDEDENQDLYRQEDQDSSTAKEIEKAFWGRLL